MVKDWSGPIYKLGKIVNKYIILDILAYVFDDHADIGSYLYSSSKMLRRLLIQTYSSLKIMLADTHLSVTLPLTFNH